MSPTHDMIIDNSTGANVRADINNALAALVSNSSSSSEPATKYAYMWWADTTNGVLKIRNSANNAWVELLQLDGTLTLEDGSASSPALSFRDDLNTGVFSSAADTFNVATGGVERMELGATTVFNEDGADVDFRIEGDTEANLFYVDAGNDRIGIGIASPESVLHVSNAVAAGSDNFALRIQNPTNASDARVGIFFHVNAVTGSGSDGAYIESANSGSDNGDIRFGNITNLTKTERMRIDSSGRLLVGKSATKQSDGENTAIAQIEDTGDCMLDIAANGTSSANHYAALNLIRSDGTSVNSHTAVDSGDIIGRLQWIGADGSDRFNSCAAIFASAASDFTANNCPANLIFSTNGGGATPTERLRIDSSGNIVTGGQGSVTGTGHQIGEPTTGNSFIRIAHSNTGANYSFMMFRHNGSDIGTIQQNSGGTAVAYNTSSDYRLKENATAISDGITRLKTLKPYRFNFKSDASTTVDGFFAHEVTAVPEAITGTKDEVDSDNNPVYQGIDQSKLVPLLVAAVQELITKVETLEAA